MKLQVSRTRLYKILGRLSVPRKTTLPVLNCALLEADDSRLFITTSTLDTFMTVSIPALVEREGALCVPFAQLKTFLKAVQQDYLIDLELETGEQPQLHIAPVAQGEFSEATLPGFWAAEFPTLDFSAKNTFEMQSGSLLDLLVRTSYACSTEESRPILNSVCWHVAGEDVRAVGTNGHILSMAVRLRPTGVPESWNVLIPIEAAKAIQKIFDPDDRIEVGYSFVNKTKSIDRICLKAMPTGELPSGYKQIYFRCMEGLFPNYETVIPSSSRINVHFERDQLLRALKELGVQTESKTHRVQFRFDKGAATMTVPPNGDGPEKQPVAMQTLPTDYRGSTPFVIDFNVNYLQGVLKHFPAGADRVVIRLTEPERAARIEAVGLDRDLALVMPLRPLDN
jgi:DNA polymerase-3 subunit beta